jgi:hypothetical protein
MVGPVLRFDSLIDVGRIDLFDEVLGVEVEALA